MASCSISTYDFDYLTRFEGKDRSFDRTVILGSFGTGIIVKKGSGDEGDLKVGDRVALEPGIFCQKCSHCIAGQTNLCPHIRYLGSEGQDGVLCRFINHPIPFTHKLDDRVSLEMGTLASKIAGCIHGYHRSGISEKSKILIMGTSLIGLLAIIIFKHLGVANILVAETNNYKLKLARKVGADHVIKMAPVNSPEYPEYLKEIISSINAGEPDIVIDTIGSSSSVENSFSLTKSGGRLVLMSLMSRPIETRFHHTTIREIDLVGAYSYTHSSFIEAIRLLSNEKIPLKEIHPIKIPLERALDAFSHGRATGGENLFILVNSYKDGDSNTPFLTPPMEKTAGVPDSSKTPIPDEVKSSPTTNIEIKEDWPSANPEGEKSPKQAEKQEASTPSIDKNRIEEKKEKKIIEDMVKQTTVKENENKLSTQDKVTEKKEFKDLFENKSEVKQAIKDEKQAIEEKKQAIEEEIQAIEEIKQAIEEEKQAIKEEKQTKTEENKEDKGPKKN